MDERVNPIILHDDYNHMDYTLEFSRESVRFAENRGFTLDVVGDKIMTGAYDLFYYAFRMHHKNVSREKTDKLIDEFWGGPGGIPDGVIERLARLWTQAFEATEVSPEKNGKLTVEM